MGYVWKKMSVAHINSLFFIGLAAQLVIRGNAGQHIPPVRYAAFWYVLNNPG